jgi:hypothetical protein
MPSRRHLRCTHLDKTGKPAPYKSFSMAFYEQSNATTYLAAPVVVQATILQSRTMRARDCTK